MTSAMSSHSEAQNEPTQLDSGALTVCTSVPGRCQDWTKSTDSPSTELPSPSQLTPARLSSRPDGEQAALALTERGDAESSQEVPSEHSAFSGAGSSQEVPSEPPASSDARAAAEAVDVRGRRAGPATEVRREHAERDSDDVGSDRAVKASGTSTAAATDATKATASAAASRAPRLSVSIRDFTYGRLLGMGSFSKVVLATYKGDGKEYALKVMSKQHIVRERKVRGVKRERMILDQLEFPGVVRMHFTFQDQDSLYMAMECCHGGDLFDQIRIQGRLPKAAAQFYAAEIVCTLEYIHSRGVVHRDLKPENLLLTADGHLRLADFGSATLIPSAATARTCQPGVQPVHLPPEDCASEERNGSFVGTAEYISPEVLNSQPATPESDLWALGCIIFHMLEGRPPFHGASEYLTFQNVLKCDYKYSTTSTNSTSTGAMANRTDTISTNANCISSSSADTDNGGSQKNTAGKGTDTNSTAVCVDQASRDIIGALLKLDPSERLGSIHKGGYGALKAHEFFAGVDWTSRLWEVEAPPLAEEEGSSEEGEEGESESEEEEVDEEWQVAHLGGSMLRLKC